MGGYDHWNKHFTFLCSLVWPLIEPWQSLARAHPFVYVYIHSWQTKVRLIVFTKHWQTKESYWLVLVPRLRPASTMLQFFFFLASLFMCQQASLLYIFRHGLVIIGEGRAVACMQSFAKTLVHTGHVQYDEVLKTHFSSLSTQKHTLLTCVNSLHIPEKRFRRKFVCLIHGHVCAKIQAKPPGCLRWALEVCIANLWWAWNCSLGTQNWGTRRLLASAKV